MMKPWANAGPIAVSSSLPGTRLIPRACRQATSPRTNATRGCQPQPTPMEINTQITKADLVEFQLYSALRSGNTRLEFLSCSILPPLAASGVLIWLTAGHLSGAIRLSFLLIVPPCVLLFYRWTRHRLAKQLDQLLGAGQAPFEL